MRLKLYDIVYTCVHESLCVCVSVYRNRKTDRYKKKLTKMCGFMLTGNYIDHSVVLNNFIDMNYLIIKEIVELFPIKKSVC